MQNRGYCQEDPICNSGKASASPAASDIPGGRWKAAAAGAFISLCTEILQLPFPSRASDVDDLILNTLGVVVGYGIFAAVKWIRKGG